MVVLPLMVYLCLSQTRDYIIRNAPNLVLQIYKNYTKCRIIFIKNRTKLRLTQWVILHIFEIIVVFCVQNHS